VYGFGDVKTGFHSWVTGKEESKEAIFGAYDLGINFFDTANCYSCGTSEKYLREAVKELPHEKFVIATKVFIPMRTEGEGDSKNRCPTAAAFPVRKSCLRRRLYVRKKIFKFGPNGNVDLRNSRL
jgi:aryl-alcohol dehydrogenase-like predicted oxidoreductase